MRRLTFTILLLALCSCAKPDATNPNLVDPITVSNSACGWVLCVLPPPTKMTVTVFGGVTITLGGPKAVFQDRDGSAARAVDNGALTTANGGRLVIYNYEVP